MISRPILSALLLLALVAFPAGAQEADEVSFDPQIVELEMHTDETTTVQVTASLPVDVAVPRVDIYLLADTTGSMGSALSNVRAGAAGLLDGLASEFPEADMAYGVGDYKDFPRDIYAFNHAQDVTTSSDDVLAAISAWSPSGGADGPEGQYYAFDRLAAGVDAEGDSIGWRDGAKRIVVTFGDAPGHLPICGAISGLGHDITETSVAEAFVSTNTTYIGVSTSSYYGLNASGSAGDYTTACGSSSFTGGQADRLAAATGGALVEGTASDLVALLGTQITAAVKTINSLTLVARGDTAGLVTGITPDQAGPITTDVPRDITFEVAVEAPACEVTPGTVLAGDLTLVADGADMAAVSMTVTALGPDGPASSTIAGTGISALNGANCDVVKPLEDGGE